MSESVGTRPSSQVPPHELPASLRDAGLANWIREPLDNAVDRRRRIIMPPAAATMGTPASACRDALLDEGRRPDTIFMMGDNPALGIRRPTSAASAPTTTRPATSAASTRRRAGIAGT